MIGIARGLLALAALPVAVQAATPDLSATEQRWLAGVRPVVEWALRQHLPLEVTVLPAAHAGDAPLALAYEEGHCELVFAMRGNPAAESTLREIPTPLLQPVLEAMAAHEIAHCWRHRDGAFSHLPAGFADAPDAIESRQPTQELRAAAREMRITRREEAYADLVGLAWTRSHQPAAFSAVLDWFDRTRATETPNSHHDTGHWLALARPAGALDPDEDLFEQAMRLWRVGLERE